MSETKVIEEEIHRVLVWTILTGVLVLQSVGCLTYGILVNSHVIWSLVWLGLVVFESMLFGLWLGKYIDSKI